MDIDKLISKYDIADHIEPDIKIPSFENKAGIILIVGSSGSGKSTILKSIGLTNTTIDDSLRPIDFFDDHEQAERLLISMGLRSIPTWFRPICTLSNGERHRAECAINIHYENNFIDEFTSVVDRNTAMSLSASFRKYFPLDKTVYIASCHRDIIDWLQPDYIYDTDIQSFISKDSARRPLLQMDIVPADIKDWVYFKKHHYLSGDLSKSSHCYKAMINSQPVAFLAVMHSTGRDIRSYWREHRLVVLPEFQGLGIGKTLSDEIAKEYVARGMRYFSKTAHVALGEYREKSENWRATSTNKVVRKSYIMADGSTRLQKGFGKSEKSIKRDSKRMCYSHEFIQNSQ